MPGRTHALFAATVLLATIGCAETAHRSVSLADAQPVELLQNDFNNISQSGEFYFAGWPSPAGLETLQQQGVKTVVVIKPPDMVDMKFGESERAFAESLGMRIVYLPISPNDFDSKDVDRFSDLVDHNEGPMLIHCGSSNTVGGLWAAYLHREQGVELEEAIRLGETAGLRSDSMREAARRVATE
ncbi:MAG: sulfur transferase domain-containing protein [Phycisphaerales bacterium]